MSEHTGVVEADRTLKVAFAGRWSVIGGYLLGMASLYVGEHYWDSGGPVGLCLLGLLLAAVLAGAAHRHGEQEFLRLWRHEEKINGGVHQALRRRLAETERRVTELSRQLDAVLRARHPEAYNELGTCWFLYPQILDELTALQAAWFAAYRDKASSGTAAIEWHDRWLPGAMARYRATINIATAPTKGHDARPSLQQNRHAQERACSQAFPAAGPCGRGELGRSETG